jgi:hypothetical protein
MMRVIFYGFQISDNRFQVFIRNRSTNKADSPGNIYLPKPEIRNPESEILPSPAPAAPRWAGKKDYQASGDSGQWTVGSEQ